jgi:hypothetical protein
MIQSVTPSVGNGEVRLAEVSSDYFQSLKKMIAQHPMRALFIGALVIRMALVLVVAFKYNGTLFGDDRTYLEMVKSFVNSQTDVWSDYQHKLWSLSLSFLLPSSLAYKLSGQNVVAVLSISALIGSLIPTLLARLLHRYVSLSVALCVGGVLAIMPSQVLWSSVMLKDSYIALGFIAIAYLLSWWSSPVNYRNFTAGSIALASLLLYVQRIRLHSLIVLCIAVLISVFIMGGRFWLPRILVASTFLFIMPWMIGGGVAGVDFARGLANGLEGQREAGAIGANTAVVPVSLPVPASVTSIVNNGSSSSSSSSSSSVPDELPIIDELKYLPSGLKVMLLDPTVPQLSRSRSLYFAFAEHLIWYPALLLALYGAVRQRKWTVDLVFSGLLFLGLCTMWALAEGNFGTAFRHRTEFVWVVFLFAGLGLQQIIDDKNKSTKLLTQK